MNAFDIMIKKLDILDDYLYLSINEDYINAFYEKFDKETRIEHIIRDYFEEVEEFNIAWMDGYDWSKISKSSEKGVILLSRFPTLELGE